MQGELAYTTSAQERRGGAGKTLIVMSILGSIVPPRTWNELCRQPDRGDLVLGSRPP